MKQVSLLYILLFYILLSLFSATASGQIIITSAGTGGSGFSGDGGAAILAQMLTPRGIALDKNGNLLICDGSRRVRKITPAYSGVITTIAGNGTPGYSGDGYEAIYAQIDGAWDVATDSKGNIFLADAGNNCIRKISTSGIISTYAGTGVAGYNGDGIIATTAMLNGPPSICVDSFDNLFICDRLNHRIRKVDTTGTIVTVVGNGTVGYSPDGSTVDTVSIDGNWAVRIDKFNNLYFSDNNRIRKIDGANKLVTIAGNGNVGDTGDGGLATSAELFVSAFCIDTTGSFYVSDGISNKVRKVQPNGIITRIAGTGIGGFSGDGGDPLFAKLYGCSGVAVSNNGEIFISDHGNNRIRLVSSTLTEITPAADLYPKIEVSPCPAHDVINISISDMPEKSINGLFFSVDGRFITDLVLKKDSTIFQFPANWPSGTYVIRLVTSYGIYSQTFIKY